jgi:hypothetical protein
MSATRKGGMMILHTHTHSHPAAVRQAIRAANDFSGKIAGPLLYSAFVFCLYVLPLLALGLLAAGIWILGRGVAAPVIGAALAFPSLVALTGWRLGNRSAGYLAVYHYFVLPFVAAETLFCLWTGALIYRQFL